MPSTASLRVLDAAATFAADIARIVDEKGTRLLEPKQLVSAAISIGANIAEGFGRSGADRLHFFRIARGSTEEALHHLRVNCRADRLSKQKFFSLSNRAVAISRMIDTLISNHSRTS